MDLQQAKKQIKQLYKAVPSIEQSEIDWLFCHILKLDRTQLFATNNISTWQYAKIKRVANMRLKGVPLSKIIKVAPFYGYNFKVNKYVLSPRLETELLVEKVIEDFKTKTNKRILDLCTGSGCIAIALKKHLNAKITASDISKKALKVAKYNANAIQTEIEFIKSDLFDGIDSKFHAIVSNPPYIKSGDIDSLQKEVKNHDPHLSLDGGQDGLEFYKKIIQKAPQKLYKNGKLYLEVGHLQADAVKELLAKNFTNINVINDLNQIERIVYATIKERIVK